MSKRQQPPWSPPSQTEATPLVLYNSLTRKKEPFVPQNENQILWYSCGPTVYDSSHMGHARSYISFDILRRVLKDYFKYDVLYVMNITDIDDKIIRRARQGYLMEQYASKGLPLSQIVEDCSEALGELVIQAKAAMEPAKKDLLNRMVDRLAMAVESIERLKQKGDVTESDTDFAKKELLEAASDPLSQWLDKRQGHQVQDNSIFSALPRKFEGEFYSDMEALNVLPPDVVTRVSEYIPEIVSFIEKIVERGFAYEQNGSVYFDVARFDSVPGHTYAKLVPEAYGDASALAEGEGDLSLGEDRLREKKSPNDFALWKASKAGEPSWNSSWGAGRPGWHIECSVMASEICGESIDIHTGGFDLKFPHHDNELAQAEAYFDNDHWIRYFIHSGHLTIAGCKMAKSLKNFITIQQALKEHSARRLRLAFLLHSWKDTLDYSANTMAIATQVDKFFDEFFLSIKDLLRRSDMSEVSFYAKWTEEELRLNRELGRSQMLVHRSLCDNVDTRSAIDALRDLVSKANSYLNQKISSSPNQLLLRGIAKYVTKMLEVFGLMRESEEIGFPTGGVTTANGVSVEDQVFPYVNALSEFREGVRREARVFKAASILKLCDELRDDVLPELGVRLEDIEGRGPVVKLVDPETLRREREAKLQEVKELAEKKERQKEEAKKKMEADKEERDSLRKVPPGEMFRRETDKYSRFDERGIPTHDFKGEEISKSQAKKLLKIYQFQEKKYNEYLKSLENN
ncbi:unnamed protein product [Cyprideis torosa]|uniref:Cysteine--tRNA ligase, cytoplasmic n=1 Tax=Cyprideis torosa TaxID=163714 RepID=A0A7R8WN53_9CRUS|nr:unnamed protein product [Cyprideis torosa]CAG0900024.1 unnamed protein product [Cyprideis torosa]